MSRSSHRAPGFAALSRGVVLLWLAIYVAGPLAPGSDADLAEPAMDTARVQPRAVEPEPAPAPAAKPPARRAPAPAASKPAEPAEPAVAAPEKLGAEEVAEGDRILAAGGDFPALSCSYEDFPSFASYSRSMQALGARFVVVHQRRIVASVDPASGRFDEPRVESGFSPRARDYTGEPALAPLARATRDRFGDGAVVMMLVPRSLDAGLFGGITRALSRRGDDPRAYREILGRYQRGPGGSVHLKVDRGTRLDGSEVPIDLLFDLAGLAGARPSA